MRTLFFTARRAVRRHAGVGEGSPDSPWLRYLSRKTRASQVPGPSSSCVPWSKTPPGADAPRPSPGATAVAFRQIEILDTRNDSTFRGQTPTAHLLACLRIAARVTANGARLATGPGGLTLGRAGFAPAGRQTKFHGGIASSLPLRPVLPGRTNFGGPVHQAWCSFLTLLRLLRPVHRLTLAARARSQSAASPPLASRSCGS